MLQQKIKEYQQIIERALEASLDLVELVEPLRSTVSYAIFPAGKRLRPVLSMLFHHECGGEMRDFAPAAAALELIHCSSLVHDDLPGVDNDDMRRGRPSCHKACGEASAIFAGDVLISIAALSVARSSLQAELKLKIIDVVMETFAEICSGQQYDVLEGEDRPPLSEICKRKTGDLFGTTLSVAALAAGMDEEIVIAARQAGLQLGLCFQMLDDYIDVYGSNEQRGRAGSSDERKAKQTFFSGVPLELAKEEWKKASKRLDEDLEYLEIKDLQLPLTRAFIGQLLTRVAIA